MYYESKKIRCVLAYRNHQQTLIARLYFSDTEKLEKKLFKWPPECWNKDTRMILPRNFNDSEYPQKLEEAMALQKRMLELALKLKSRKKVKQALNGQTPTITEISNQIAGSPALSKSTRKQYQIYGRCLVKHLGNLEVDEITDLHIYKLDEKLSKHTHNSARAYHAHLKRVLLFSIRAGYISYNPYEQIKTLSKKPKRERKLELTKEHLGKLKEVAYSDHRLSYSAKLFLLQLLVGCRFAEAVELTRECFDKGYYIPSKTGNKVPLFLHKDVEPLLEYLPLPIKYKTHWKNLKALGEKLGGIDLCTHDARRLFASMLSESSKDIMIVKKALGHSSVKMTELYVKTSQEKLKGEVFKVFSV